ncbi:MULTISPECIES: TetR/AcrR family transcriptional regulator [Streptomyces]|uniref:TetR/AcrR family transcriptional regulator n=1 Tax=Streptomyces silvisoli TaxID=3034235 RepID=A0ABT5ZI38_9ACTN|nr:MULTISPECIES: TetR/AcrR family transcriptional regulator [Streptomyces]MDF3289490.1 TetR/AcrR family transcriptional regulator [Streptomyces silvisoli]
MPTARDSLLNAALSALDVRAWSSVRMVDVAAAAGVSRQTLYNEFGTKEGLARALARRETDDFLAGVDQALAAARQHDADPADCLAAATAWTLRTARRSPLVRAAITGCRTDRLPTAVQPPAGELARTLRDRVAAVLGPERGGWVYEAAVRLAVSYVVAPATTDEDACAQVARLVRGLSEVT